jgi:hypothetical protein
MDYRSLRYEIAFDYFILTTDVRYTFDNNSLGYESGHEIGITDL